MISTEDIKRVYFLGIGGIGMSALARYFNSHGYDVCGYDRVETPLTIALQEEGIDVVFDDDPEKIPSEYFNIQTSLVVFTPAIPLENKQKNAFLEKGFNLYKRAEVLGMLSRTLHTLAVAGTHGKTTVSTMLAWIMQFHKEKAHAFLGGISANFQSNYKDADVSTNMVVEADEFDRSFLQLSPDCSIITAMDADHLDIYGNHENLIEAFNEFVNSNRRFVIAKYGLDLNSDVNVLTYSLDNCHADFYVSDIYLEDLCYRFNLHTPDGVISDLKLGVPGILNLENSIAASAMALMNGLEKNDLKEALSQFKGIKRRFEVVLYRKDFVYIDDYAHHPVEISRTLESLRKVFPDKRLTVVFQPHLYSRTQDFAKEFAESLSEFDEVVLLPIYPARELPIPGVKSELIRDLMPVNKGLVVEKIDLENVVVALKPEVLVTLGAGDIDRYVQRFKDLFDE